MSHDYRIVVGYDGSAIAELALRSAFDAAAKEVAAEVHVVHVLAAFVDYFPSQTGEVQAGLAKVTTDVVQAVRERALGVLAAWSAEKGATFSRVVTHVRYDDAAREVAQLASDLGAALIVVGTHGRRGFRHFTMGSVAEGVVRLARCPVLVVRPLDTSQEVPAILPPCERCVETRRETNGAEYWCEQHRERHGQRHTHHTESRGSQPINLPLVLRE